MLENYGKYRNVRDAAWHVLIDFNMCNLPIKVSEIASKANIKIIKNSESNILNKKQAGLSVRVTNQWYIIFDDSLSDERARFTIAHELGHIFLGHKSLINGINDCHEEKPNEEKEADMFAIRLLAPACVLKGLDLHTSKEISNVCNISIQAAQYRANRMKILYDRNKFFLSPLERRVFKNFEKYITEYNKNKTILIE